MFREVGVCKRCGGPVVEDDTPTVGFPHVEVVRCIKCGERYYKGHPKREGRLYETCGICGKLFKRKKKNYDSSICPECSANTESKVRYCIVCGAPIVKGFCCTKPKCNRARKKIESLETM